MHQDMLFRLAFVAFATLTTGLTAAEPPPRPASYEVPFSAPQNFIDHARFFEEETIQGGPYKIWNFGPEPALFDQSWRLLDVERMA